MIKIDEQTVLECARLAKVKIDDQRLPSLREELVRIMDFVNTLNEVDTSDIEINSLTTENSNVTRTDEPIIYSNPQELIECAPVSRRNYVVVPGVIE